MGASIDVFVQQKEPFCHFAPQVMFNVVHEGLRPEVPADCPEEYVGLMRSCWAAAAGDR